MAYREFECPDCVGGRIRHVCDNCDRLIDIPDLTADLTAAIARAEKAEDARRCAEAGLHVAEARRDADVHATVVKWDAAIARAEAAEREVGRLAGELTECTMMCVHGIDGIAIPPERFGSAPIERRESSETDDCRAGEGRGASHWCTPTVPSRRPT